METVIFDLQKKLKYNKILLIFYKLVNNKEIISGYGSGYGSGSGSGSGSGDGSGSGSGYGSAKNVNKILILCH